MISKEGSTQIVHFMTPGAGVLGPCLTNCAWRSGVSGRFLSEPFFAFLPVDHSCCWSWSRIRNRTDLRKLLLFWKTHIYHQPVHHRVEDFKKDLQAYSFQNAMNIFFAHWGNEATIDGFKISKLFSLLQIELHFYSFTKYFKFSSLKRC